MAAVPGASAEKAATDPSFLPTANPYKIPADKMKQLDTLRKAVDKDLAPEGTYWSSNQALQRFFDARKGDIEAARAQYVNAMEWRREHEIDTLLDWFEEPEVMRRYFPSGFVGHDKDGFPLLVERIGNIDFPGMYRAVGEATFLRWVALYHERQELLLRKATQTAGELRDKMSVIIDLNGLSIGMAQSATLNVLRKRTTLEERIYPEVVRTVFLINAPMLFSGVWQIVQYFVDEGTRVKMNIYSSASATKAALTDRVEIPELPAFLGGELRQPEGDDECSALIGHGGLVHPGYFVGPDPRCARLVLPAGGAVTARFVMAPGAVLRARHAATKNEIQFRLFVRAAPDAAAKDAIAPCDGGAATVVLPSSDPTAGSTGAADDAGCMWLHRMTDSESKAAGIPPVDGADRRESTTARWSDRWRGAVVGAAATAVSKAPSSGWAGLAGEGALLADGHDRMAGDWESVVAGENGAALVGAPVWMDSDRKPAATALRTKGAGGLGGGEAVESLLVKGGAVEVMAVWSNEHSWVSNSEAIVRLEVESAEQAAKEVGAGHGGGALVKEEEEGEDGAAAAGGGGEGKAEPEKDA